MNILDENIIETQCRILRAWRIRYRQIGSDIGTVGMKDMEIVSLLHNQNRPTFFTRDDDFFERSLSHPGYCLVHTAVEKNEVAVFIRRFLRHPRSNTKAKRMGSVVRITHTGLLIWYLNAEKPQRFQWID